MNRRVNIIPKYLYTCISRFSQTVIMLRGCVSLVARASPVSQVLRGMSRRVYNNRVQKPLLLEFNKRRRVVELDNRLKNKDSVVRRSSYTDWNYPAELKAIQVGNSI